MNQNTERFTALQASAGQRNEQRTSARLPLYVSHDLWTSLTREQQAEQRAKYYVTVGQAYRPADDLDQLREMAPVAKEGK